MSWIEENAFNIIPLLFGTGGIGFAVISKALDRKRYEQEVRDATSSADIKGDEFWKKRYDVLQNEVEYKDTWWKARYETLYSEFQSERKLSNEIIVCFRNELSEMRLEYDKQREAEKRKYTELVSQYDLFEEESKKREKEYKSKINQLEVMINEYEVKLRNNE